jgi:hypothetical protein
MDSIFFSDPGILNESYTAQINWGDGHTEPAVLSKANDRLKISGEHVYADNQSYIAIISVWDDDSGVGTDTSFIKVNNVPPNLKTVKSIEGYAGRPIVIDTLSFIDPGGDRGAYAMNISWGDNSSESKTVQYLQNIQNLFTHTYTASNTYKILIRISDKDGGLDADSITAHIVSYDDIPPYRINSYPPDGSKFIPINTDVSFDLIDDFYGVKMSSIQMSVNGNNIISNGIVQGNSKCDINALQNGYRVWYAPSQDFDTSSTVIINIKCEDRFDFPNVLTDTLTFRTGNMRMKIVAESAISPAGGNIGTNAGLTISIPNGALQGSRRVYIATVNKSPGLPDSLNTMGNVYFLGPHRLRFQKPVDITFTFSDEQMKQAGAVTSDYVRLVVFSDSTSNWQIQRPIQIDNQYHLLKSTVHHFSLYQIAGFSQPIEKPKSDESFSAFNYPNPFNPDNMSTIIKCISGRDVILNCTIYDLSGMVVRFLKSNMPMSEAVVYNIEWDGKNGNGQIVSNDVYYCVISTDKGDHVISKIAVLR